MYVIKAAAALLVLAVARTVSGEYKKFTDKKLLLCEGFISLLSFIKAELSCRGRTVSEWSAEFENAALAEIGFLEKLRSCGNLHAAFSSTLDKIPMLGSETVKLLDSYFSSFGKSYRNEEESEACRVFDELVRLLARERSDVSRSVRAVRTLSYAIGLGVIILFL